MKPHELACQYYLEERGYLDMRPFRQCPLEDKSWLLWFEMPEGELLLHATWQWEDSIWRVTSVYFEVD